MFVVLEYASSHMTRIEKVRGRSIGHEYAKESRIAPVVSLRELEDKIVDAKSSESVKHRHSDHEPPRWRVPRPVIERAETHDVHDS